MFVFVRVELSESCRCIFENQAMDQVKAVIIKLGPGCRCTLTIGPVLGNHDDDLVCTVQECESDGFSLGVLFPRSFPPKLAPHSTPAHSISTNPTAPVYGVHHTHFSEFVLPYCVAPKPESYPSFDSSVARSSVGFGSLETATLEQPQTKTFGRSAGVLRPVL